MFLENVRFIGRIYFKHAKPAFMFLLMTLAGMVLQPLLSVYLPRTVVLAVSEGWSIERMAFWAGIFTFGLIGCNLLSTVGVSNYRVYCNHGRFAVQNLWTRMRLTCRYDLLENPKWQSEMEDCSNEVYADWATHGLTGFTCSWMHILCSMIGITTFSVILGEMHPLILLLLAATAVLTGIVDSKTEEWMQNQRSKFQPYLKEINYVYNHVTSGQAGKDLRLYEAAGYYLRRMEAAMMSRLVWGRKILTRKIGAKGVGALMLALQNGAALGWLVYQTAAGHMDVAQFTLYASSVVQFTMFINQFLQWIGIFKRSNLDIKKVRDGLAYMPEEQQVKVGLKKKSDGEAARREVVFEKAPCIRFEHVTFRYPNSERPILDDVSFTIQAGEKVALVGENGAGKTTIVKLLCGLYQPESGKIWVDQYLLEDLSEASRCSLFSAVFQDMLVLPFNVLVNVSIGQKEDVHRVRRCLELAGLSERFPNLNLNLVRGSAEDAEDLSGGEQQKLLLARALYKEAPALILDEPTAALDPLSESELYEQYNELTKDKTAVFISHRLASTRFCSRIFLIGDGRILEEGSHEELLSRGGQYAWMFREQSKYYQEVGKEEGGAST